MSAVLLTVLLLALMEVSLSFDNAVLNASILQNMSAKWQHRFLTWGMPIAVCGMRLLFPVLIVAVAASLPITDVVMMAVSTPAEYARHLSEAHIQIAAFGGIFLLMVFLEFICDSAKELHWIGPIEKRLSALGLLKGVEIIIAGLALMVMQHYLPLQQSQQLLLAGLGGIGLYMLIQAFMGLFDSEQAGNKLGLMSFIYLEVLDASCSFDGVIGAFVLTNNIILISIGLGIGALAIRSLTLYLVHGGKLKEFIYLEHGAHYGIGALAVIMLTDIFYPVPEPVTGCIGLGFIGLSLWSSVKHNKKELHAPITPIL